MRANRIPTDEQYRLIMECRASGLTDYEWCLQHDIKPGTFYNWVKRLRQKCCPELPDATAFALTKKIADFILKNGKITNKEVQQLLAVKDSRALKVLKELVEMDIILKQGKLKGSPFKGNTSPAY